MPNTNTPRGFRPVGSVVAASFSGQLSEGRIASGYGSNIFTGDCVAATAAGQIAVAAAGAPIRGVAQGFRWVAADGTPRVSPYWPAGTVTLNGQDAICSLIDDPNMIFECRFGNSGSSPVQADVGALFDISTGTAGNVATGQSGQCIDYASLATTLKQFRFLGFVQRPDNDISTGNAAYAVGRFVPVNHDLRLQVGI